MTAYNVKNVTHYVKLEEYMHKILTVDLLNSQKALLFKNNHLKPDVSDFPSKSFFFFPFFFKCKSTMDFVKCIKIRKCTKQVFEKCILLFCSKN